MEKQYFKYGSGYVNIDNQNLYLTNSGNWQETRELKEKSPVTMRKNKNRINQMKGFVYTFFGIFVSAIIASIENKKVSFTLIAILGAIAYFLLEYFKSEFGSCYKIPLSKIDSVEYEKKAVIIHFRNEANETDKEKIDNVEPKGFEVLLEQGLIKA